MACECKVRVQVEGRSRPLRPRNDIRDHSPDGFEWGYSGSGPSQLALALVADCCGRERVVPMVYQRFKSVVAALPHDGWTLTAMQISRAVAEIEAEGGFE